MASGVWVGGARGALIDVDGTLLHGDAAIPGAAEFLDRLDAAGIGWRLTTNTTRRPRAAVVEALAQAGIGGVPVERVLTPAILARERVLGSGRTRAALLVPEATHADLGGVIADEERPDWVVVGDLGAGFTWNRLDRAFHALLGGALLLALHRNPRWLDGDRGWQIDAGAFVAALECAASVTAEVVGKPSAAFFEMALASLGLPARAVVVVGDDPCNDGLGAARAGCRTALVRGAGASPREVEGFQPDVVVDTVAALAP
jgi:HAD superfamily hydrolase (TIGR01458 family)